MEPRFGYDFGHVRVHADAKAAESVRAVKAFAYTVGDDIVFGAGQYVPNSATGRKLMAHELTHVIQQGRMGRRFQRQEDPAARSGTASTPTTEYIVARGDTLSRIARRYGTTVAELRRLNNLPGSNIRLGQTIQVPASGSCGIVVPPTLDGRFLAGAIFAEAAPRPTAQAEREAIGWAFINSVQHTEQLCTGAICASLNQRQRTAQCRRDTRDLGRTLRNAISIGSVAVRGSRWNMVMSSSGMLPAVTLCKLVASERTALTRAIAAARSVLEGTATRRDYLRFNRAADSPPSPRMVRTGRHEGHTFYQFIAGRECG
jgi:LysM repeat protein